RFGPHVRVCVPGDLTANEVASRLETVTAYLAEKPSRAQIDPDAYAVTSHRLGSAELELPPYEPLWADNSVVVGEYSPRADLLDAGIPIKEEFLHRALPIVRRIAADVGGS